MHDRIEAVNAEVEELNKKRKQCKVALHQGLEELYRLLNGDAEENSEEPKAATVVEEVAQV